MFFLRPMPRTVVWIQPNSHINYKGNGFGRMICHLLHCFFLKRFFCERFICCPADGSTDVWHQDISLPCSCRQQHCGMRALFYKGAYEIIEVWDGLGWPKKNCMHVHGKFDPMLSLLLEYIYIYINTMKVASKPCAFRSYHRWSSHWCP